MKVTGPYQKPNPHPFYGDSWERGKDPWHINAFPTEYKHFAPNHGKRKEGWFLLDAFGNQIGFVKDGTPVDQSVACSAVIVVNQDKSTL